MKRVCFRMASRQRALQLASVVCSLDMRRNSHFGENIVASAVQKPFVGLAKARACEACKGLFLVGFNMC